MSARKTKRLALAMFCWILLLAQGRCAPDRVAVEVAVTGLLGTEAQLIVDATLDGRALSVAQPRFTTELDHFQVRVGSADRGSLILNVTALGADGCNVASGRATVDVEGDSGYSVAIELAPETGCLLTVRKVGYGAGQVSLSTGAVYHFDMGSLQGSACPTAEDAGVEMQQSFLLNTQIGLTASVPAQDGSFFEGWTQACHGSGGCEVTISPGQTVVEAGFVGNFLCSVDHICWEQPRPQGSRLRAISGSGDGEAWALGIGSELLKWNGSYWTQRLPPMAAGPGQLNAISVVSLGNLFLVGAQGLAVRLANGIWQCPEQIAMTDLQGVFASTSTDAWAVGLQGTIVHWDGQSWTAIAAPGVSADLNAVAGYSPTDVWAVGGGGTVLHFDGAAWSAKSFPTQDALLAVYASGANEAWAIGDHGLIAHLKDDTVDTSLSMAMPIALRAIWGASASQIWVVGDRGTVFFIDGQTAKTGDAGTTHDLLGVWGSSISDVWAVGDGGVLSHFNGTYWQLASTNRDYQSYNAIAASASAPMSGPRPLSIVGDLGLVLQQSPSSWQTDMRFSNVSGQSYRALFIDRSDDVWLVGQAGTAVHWDGMLARAFPTGTMSDLLAVWGSGQTNVLAVGARGVLARFDGTRWMPSMLMAAGGNTLNAIWGSSSSQVFMAGDKGTLLQFNGTTATAIPTSIPGALRALWGSGPTDAWAVGDAGVILHWNGTAWGPDAQSGQLTQSPLRAIWGTAPDAVWAVGDRGTVLYFDGMSWTSRQSGCDKNLRGVAGDGSSVFFIGEAASILRFEGR